MAKTVKDLENAFERIKNMDIINENVTHVTNFLEQLSAEGIGHICPFKSTISTMRQLL